jgi:hypothetical protein
MERRVPDLLAAAQRLAGTCLTSMNHHITRKDYHPGAVEPVRAPGVPRTVAQEETGIRLETEAGTISNRPSSRLND